MARRYAFFPVGHAGKIVVATAGCGRFIEQSEEAGLSLRSVLLHFLGAVHGLVDSGHQRATLTERVERASFDERFDDAFVHHAQVDLFAELPEAFELAANFLAGFEDRLDGVTAHVFYGSKTESDGLAMGGELGAGDLYIGWFDADAKLAALADVFDNVVRLGCFRREQARP